MYMYDSMNNHTILEYAYNCTNTMKVPSGK